MSSTSVAMSPGRTVFEGRQETDSKMNGLEWLRREERRGGQDALVVAFGDLPVLHHFIELTCCSAYH